MKTHLDSNATGKTLNHIAKQAALDAAVGARFEFSFESATEMELFAAEVEASAQLNDLTVRVERDYGEGTLLVCHPEVGESGA